MSEYLKVEDSFVEAIVENAAWAAAKVGLVEKAKVKEQDDEEEVPVKEKKVKEVNTKGPDTEPNAKSDAVKKLAKQGQSDAEDDDDDEMKESVEAHTCPLCESTLEEELSDEQIREHVAQIQAAIQSIEEGGDDDGPSDDDLDAIEAEPNAPSNDDDMDEKKKKKKSAKKESVMKKVKELKKASKGK